jgi:putative ABC transport system substrate-binding protein
VVVAAVALCVALVAPLRADQTQAIPRIGVLTSSAPNAPGEEGLRTGLRELGYADAENAHVEWRRSAGTLADLRVLAVDLMRTKVDVIVTLGTPATRAALDVTTSVPIVFLVGDPVLLGFADSLARPGGNATGVSIVDTDLSAKRLELLRACVPRATRILYLMNSSNPVAPTMLKETEKAAHTLGVTLVRLDARNTDELESALQAILRSREDAILVSPDPLFQGNIAKIKVAVHKARLPGMFPYREYHGDGALMSYGANLKEASRRAATYVDRILKGARPADLPIEQISAYELVIDLRTARTVGVTVPQDLLLRADEVIR